MIDVAPTIGYSAAMIEATYFHNESLDKFPGLSFDATMYIRWHHGEISLDVRDIDIWLEDAGGDLQPVRLGETPTHHWLYLLIEPAIEQLAIDRGLGDE